MERMYVLGTPAVARQQAEGLMFLKSPCSVQAELLFANTQGCHWIEQSVVPKRNRKWIEENKKRE